MFTQCTYSVRRLAPSTKRQKTLINVEYTGAPTKPRYMRAQTPSRIPALHNAHNVRLFQNTADLPVNVQGVRSVEGHHLPSPSRSLEGVSAYHRGVRRRYLMPVCMCVHISSNSSLNTLPRDRLSSSVYKPNQVCPPCLRVGHRTSHTVSLAAFAF